MKRFYYLLRHDPVWSKVFSFSLVTFVIALADGVISFWAPNLIQSSLKSPVLMGIIIGFQSVVGFAADLLFPHILRNVKTRRLIFLAMVMLLGSVLCLLGAQYKPFILLFLLTMTIWGVYYELISFANYQFVGSTVPLQSRSSAWGVISVFRNMSYFLGPLAATWFLAKGYISAFVFIAILLFIAFLVLSFQPRGGQDVLEMDLQNLNPWEEIKHWLTLSKYIWPAIIMSLVLGFIDSTFWTTGAVWTEKLVKINSWGGFFLPFYQLPPLIVGFVVVKLGIYKGKKITATKYMLLAGFFLTAIILSPNIYWQLFVVLASSAALSITFPLLESVYSDLSARMGKERKHIIGLTSSVVNFSYIIWPVIAGIITSKVGERTTFSIMGAITIFVAVILLVVTPKKLRLPQAEIGDWKD